MGGVPFLLALLVLAGLSAIVAEKTTLLIGAVFCVIVICAFAAIVIFCLRFDWSKTQEKSRHTDQQQEDEMIARQAGTPYVRKPFDGH